MSVFAFLIFFLQFPLGQLLISYIDINKKLTITERYFATIVIGPTITCFILLCLLLLTGSWTLSIFTLWAILIIPLLFLLSKYQYSFLIRFTFPKSLNYKYLSSIGFWILLTILILYSGILFGGFLLNEQGFPVVISLGWADTSYHLSMIGRLATADPFILEHPVISGQSLTYPFMLNLLTALYQKIGFTLFTAWHLSNALYGISFVFLIYLFGKRFLDSKVSASLLVGLVLFGGGIGFFLYFNDLSIALGKGGFSAFFNTIFNPPHEYTHLQFRDQGRDPAEYGIFHNIYWIVPAISFLSHQRTFLPGLAIAVLLFIGLYAYRGNKNMWRWSVIWAGIPLFHTHSFIATSIVLACWFFLDLKNYRSWIIAGLIGTLLALPQVLYLAPSNASDDFSLLRPWFGWMMCTHSSSWFQCNEGTRGTDTNLIWFLTKNFGVVFWGWVISIVLYILYISTTTCKKVKQSIHIIIPSLFLFLIPILVLFQPWEFDNNKILYYWWIFASICTLKVVNNIFANRSRMATAVLLLVMILSTLSGIIDVMSRVTKITANHYGYYDNNDVKVSEWINNNTIPNARFLTGDFVDQFVPILSGRSIYAGYPGWLWSQGKSALSIERTRKAQNFLTSGNSEILCDDGVGYVVWDRRLISTYPDVNKDNVLSSSKVVFSTGTSDVIEITCE